MADINVLATFPHYVEHMMPVIDALRDRGVDIKMWSTRREVLWGEYIHKQDIEAMGTQLWFVASSMDAHNCLGQRLIYLEHGAGQTYTADANSLEAAGYSSGPMDDAIMFLCPNLYVMNRRQQRYPDVPCYLVGSPKMDEYYHAEGRRHEGVIDNLVAMAWHWDCGACEESRTAWEHYRPWFNRFVVGLRREGVRLVGTSHPRIAKRAQWHYERHAIEWWESDQVLWQAAALTVDNSTLGYEFASLDRPVLWLNCPQYRRSVHHGLRFWEYIPGEQIDEPEQYVEAVCKMLDSDHMHEWRMHVSDLVFPLRDARAAERGAAAVMTLLS